ncbi:MAG: hypothetical protein VX871_03695 [Pseudomonadota bacterium]|nr:hypothetical protein [Pseudomonadota bacterium]
MPTKDDRKKTGVSADEAESRPRPTIELSADEVSEVKETPDPDKTAEADTSATDEQPDGKAARRRPPPQRTQPSDVRSFVTHLAAGLVGGVAGVIAAGIGLDKLPLLYGSAPAPVVVEDNSGRIAELEKRLAGVQERLDAKGNAAELEQRIDTIDARLKAADSRIADIAQSLTAASGKQTEQAEQVARLEATLKSLGDAAKSGGGEAVAPAAAVAQQVNDLTARLETRIDAVEKKIAVPAAPDEKLATRVQETGQALASLREEVKVIASREAGGPPADLAPVEQRLAALETRLDALSGAASAAAEAKSDAALAVALPALRRSIEFGRPYEAELAALKPLAPQGADLAPLVASAVSGVATIASLKASSAAALQAAAREMEPKPETVMDQLLSSARDIVRVQRVGGAGTQDSFAAIRTALDKGDVAAALAAVDKLPAPARAAMEPWAAKARARLAVDKALAEVERQAAAPATAK